MQVYIAGRGKLASELLERLNFSSDLCISAWLNNTKRTDQSIVVHAGSGRELNDLMVFCQRTSSPLIELATGSDLEQLTPSFPVVLCPNTNLLMLKFMSMLERNGALFSGHQVEVIESHQASKCSVPGTAVAIAKSLGLNEASITSIRDPSEQFSMLGIPKECLARHAFHRVQVTDGSCSIIMETRILGEAPYASGVQKIIEAVSKRKLEARIHSISEFIENGWV